MQVSGEKFTSLEFILMFFFLHVVWFQYLLPFIYVKKMSMNLSNTESYFLAQHLLYIFLKKGQVHWNNGNLLALTPHFQT